MPWRPLPRIAFAVATFPFQATSPADLPLEIGDELYIIEQGGQDASWFRGYLVAPPSLLAGLTSVKGQALEARVFSGIFPKCCVEVREVLGDTELDGHAHGSVSNSGSPRFDHSNGDALRRQSSLVHKGSMRRNRSSDSAGTKPATNGGSPKISPAPHRPNRTSSQHLKNPTNDKVLARQLSHRSLTSSQPKSSPGPFTPTSDTLRALNRKRPQAPVPMLKIGDETPTSSSEPLVDEIASCLREWHSKNLHELLLARRYSVLEKGQIVVNRLNLARRQLLHGVLTARELDALREEIVWNIVDGNKMLNSEIIVRDPKQRGRLLTGDDSAIEMTKLQSTMSLLDRPPVFQHDPVNLYHLMIDVKAFANNGLMSPTLIFYLCSRSPGEPPKALTESFVLDLPPQEEFEKLASAGRYRTLFTDLTSNDIGDASRSYADLYLVVKVQASQAIRKASLSQPKRANPVDENASTSTPNSSGFSNSASIKGGRQSLMWAQKQFGSVRKAQQDSRTTQLPSTPESPDLENGTRPTTGDASRPSTQQGPQCTRRSIGIGVFNIKHVFRHDVTGDQSVSIWTPAVANGSADTLNSSDDWDEIIRELASSRNGAYTRCKPMEHVRLAFQSFADPDANDLIGRTPTLLQNVVPTPKIDFPGAPTKARSDIYVRISEVFLPHQALLSYSERRTVQLTSSLELKNVQLTLEVRTRSGERIERCIFPGSNSLGQTAWRSSAVERSELWDQMIKLVIPTDDVPGAHLIMSIADAPGFPFALSWMPLWTDKAFIKDGSHAPLLYVYDKVTASSDNGRGAYLALPWNSKGRYGDVKDEVLTGPIATLKLETKLCSTFFSQDTILPGILKWREQQKIQILDLLERFAFVPEIEIVKLVSEVFEALFSILARYHGMDEYEDLAFNALVTVLGIVHDRRFNLGPFVDTYAETKFDHPSATPCLIRGYLRLLANPADPQKSRRVRAAFKVGRQLLKFIVCARRKQETREAGIGANTETAFKRDVGSIFGAFNGLMEDSSAVLVGSKTLVVQHMHSWLPELKGLFSEEEIFQIARDFLGACASVEGKLILHKLVFILNLTSDSLFSQVDVGQQVLRATAEWIDPYWGVSNDSTQWREQVRLCCSIAAKQVQQRHFKDPGYYTKAIESYRSLLIPGKPKNDQLSLLYPTTYPFPSKPLTSPIIFDEAITELAGLLAALAGTRLPSRRVGTEIEYTDMLSPSLDVVMSILSGGAFPKEWLSLYIFHHRASLQMLESLFEVMVTKYLPSPDDAGDFDEELWRKYLLTLLTLVRSDTLALETFPEQKRRAVWKIAGDVREQGAGLLKRSWEAIGWEASHEEQSRYGLLRLGGFQVQYVPSLVAPIIDLCLSVHEGLRNVAVRILQAMIISEWSLNEDLSVIQAEMIDCFETLFKSKNIGESLVQKMFVNELLDMFESLARAPGDPMWQAINDMISTIDELLELLAAVHSPDITESLRTMNTLQLMSFLKDTQKEEIFIRYVHQLAEVQARLHNKTEAGLALRLHADLYTWESTNVKPLTDPAFPEQSSFDRKERLYFEMIKYFEEGEAWHSALSSYRELANQYEHSHYDFAKLARTQRAMATIYETITKGEWQIHRYFRVTYHGLGFPSNLRDKQFIYEGEPSERQSAFTDRMRQLHPAAQVIPKGEVEDEEGQYLQIFSVSVYRDLDHPIHQQPKVVQSTRDYISSARPNLFAVTSKRHSPASGVQNQWIEKTLYKTKESFPTILRRSEVVAVDATRLSPLQTAVERTSRKTSELAALLKRISSGDESNITSLTDSIISSVDPSSAATVAQYRQLLPTAPEDAEEDVERPALSPLQKALQIALIDHTSTLKHCLSQYLRPDHAHTRAFLSEHFQETFSPELALLAPNPTPDQHHLFTSPPHFSMGNTLSVTPTLTNGTNHIAEELPSEPRSRPLSLLSFSFIKNSTTSVPKANGTSVSAPSEDGTSSSGKFSQVANSSGHCSTSANTTAPLPMEASAERPTTAQSGRSGKVKRRFSRLGLSRMVSARDKAKADLMDGVAEE
ncbi:MAG: hypothetical protein ALECFALPRED_001119 [Alectoria fallacina]|uniref:Dedicator of cytokinesis protein 1 n=1 Tax=Alectoria fallacina TaxID=1903189 RepID=A0A8H3F7C5_9LECA|nr:MAG: hypothetical protein ALECFALPRED_001119 [Alectoria fallacina]